MTTRRDFLATILGGGPIALSGCAMPSATPALSPADEVTLIHPVSALNNMLLTRAEQNQAVNTDVFKDADATLAQIKAARPANIADTAAFEAKKLEYIVTTTRHAIEQGAGSLVVKIAKAFPQITGNAITLPDIGKYNLSDDLAANYGKTMPPDISKEIVQQQMQAIAARASCNAPGRT